MCVVSDRLALCRRAPKEFQFWLFTDKLLYGQVRIECCVRA
jgi:hypothetical protein